MFNFNQYSKIKFITKEFEKLLLAQGWNVKWELSSRCSCWKDEYGEPDINCTVCRGRGYFYTRPHSAKVAEEKAKILTVDRIKVLNTPSKILRVWNKSLGVEYEVASFTGGEITLTGTNLLNHYGVFVEYEYDLSKTYTETVSVSALKRDEIIVSNKYIDEIVSIHNNTTNTACTASYFTDNKVKLSTVASVTDEISITYVAIKPIKMILTDVKENKYNKPVGEFVEGDANVTFMPWFNIGERDKLTILHDEVVTRYVDILKRGESETMKMDTIVKIMEVRDVNRVYVEDVDYKFVGTHKIEWLDQSMYPSAHAPEQGEQYSVMYLARREYMIWGEVPQERHHGEVLLPRRLLARKLEKVNFTRDASYNNGV